MAKKTTTATKKTRARKSGLEAAKFKIDKCLKDLTRTHGRVEKWGSGLGDIAESATAAVGALAEALSALPCDFQPPTGGGAKRNFVGSGVILKPNHADAYENILDPTKIYKVQEQRGKFLVLTGSSGGLIVGARNHFARA